MMKLIEGVIRRALRAVDSIDMIQLEPSSITNSKQMFGRQMLFL